MPVIHEGWPTVVVVDDEGLDLWVPGMLLKPYNINMVECSLEWELISVMLQTPINLMLLNPYALGVDAASLKNLIGNFDLQTPKIIAAYLMSGQTANLQRLGMQTVLHKPLKSAAAMLRLLGMSVKNGRA